MGKVTDMIFQTKTNRNVTGPMICLQNLKCESVFQVTEQKGIKFPPKIGRLFADEIVVICRSIVLMTMIFVFILLACTSTSTLTNHFVRYSILLLG